MFLFPLLGVAQSVEFIAESSYWPALVGPVFGTLESTGSPDNGGLISLFLKNDHPASGDEITDVKVYAGTQELPVDGWRSWPVIIAPGGGTSFLNIKGGTNAFSTGQNLTVQVTTTGGQVLSKSIQTETTSVKLVNIVPSQEMNRLFFYLRNDGQEDFLVSRLHLNEWEFEVGISPELSVVGSTPVIKPSATLILSLSLPFIVSENFPLSARVRSQRLSGGPLEWTTHGVRLVAAHFPLGSWHSSAFNPENMTGRHRLRTLALNSMHGPGNPQLMQDGVNRFFIRTVWEPSFGDPFNPALGAATVSAHSATDYVHVWSVDDEPDLNNKPIPEQIEKSWVYWQNDPNTPSYVNLASQKKYQRYGWHTDVVSMDHYTSPAAPNVIPNSWIPFIGRVGSLREALEYSEYLKYNLEPRRTWSWSQLAGSVWSYPPKDFEVNYQFWAHIMGGAKGIHWFVAQSNTQANYPEQWNEAFKLTRQLNPVKNLILYGEPLKIVQTDNNKTDSRALVGPDAMVVMAANNDATFNYNVGALQWNAVSNAHPFWIQFTVPDWISIDQIYEAVPDGKIPVQGLESFGNRTYRITGNIHKESRVFVFAKNDDQAPGAPQGLQMADFFNDEEFVLSWKEPWDNFGVAGYEVFADNILLDSVSHPIYTVKEGVSICEVNQFKVRAYDASGNLSAFDTFSPILVPSQVQPQIVAQPLDAWVTEGQDTLFEVIATGSEVMYDWFMSTDDGLSWTEVQNDGMFSGANTPQLRISAVPAALHNTLFRCRVNAFCNDLADTSLDGRLRVVGVSLEESAHADWQIFPNPTASGVFIDGFSGQNLTRISVLNPEGKVLIRNEEPSSGLVYLSLDGLAPGLYFISVTDPRGTHVQKVIKH